MERVRRGWRQQMGPKRCAALGRTSTLKHAVNPNAAEDSDPVFSSNPKCKQSSQPPWHPAACDSDDPDTSAYMVGQHVFCRQKRPSRYPLTPTASAAFDTKDTGTFNTRVMDDNDEMWAIEADHRTGWNKTFKSGTYRGMLYGAVLRDYPKQVVSLTKAKSVPTNMREFFSWAQRHYRMDVTASTVERETGGPAFEGTCPGGCKELSHKGSNAHSIKLTCKICGTVRREERHPPRQDPAAAKTFRC